MENKSKKIKLDITQCYGSELQVGITEYINETKGFTGILKQRYSDFIVNEIDNFGNIVHLKDSGEIKDKIAEEETSFEDIEKILSPDIITQLESFSDASSDFISIPNTFDKQQRKSLHLFIKKKFASLTSETKNDGNSILIRKKDKNDRCDFSYLAKKQTISFTLYKENKDTFDAINLLSKLTGIQSKNFSIAGTKDKRGITTQKVSVRNGSLKNFQGLNSKLFGMEVGDFTVQEKPLRLGDLKGNRFNIVLRNVVGDIEDINTSINSVKKDGFLNYYGMQRFGSGSVPTHYIGKSILLRDFKNTIDLILLPRENESSDVAAAREIWAETMDPKKSLEAFPKRCIGERAVLQSLLKFPGNFLNALNSIPRNLRLMYVHAYQSFVWNCAVSERIRLNRKRPIVGDLVNIGISERSDDDGNYSSKILVKLIETEEETNNFSLLDVVLPLPGYSVQYPTNEIGEFYKKLMEIDHLNPQEMKGKDKDYSLPGEYRHLLVEAQNLKYDFVRYSDYTRPLINCKEPHNIDDKENGEEKPLLLALVLSFDLPPSSYATMVLREIMKLDTGSSFQSTLNEI